MRRLFGGGTIMIVGLAFSVVAFAQQAQTPQQQTPTTTPSAQSAGQQTAMESVTITGCVQSEADYRRAHNLGRGGAVGTGAGVGNEYVLVNASRSSGGASPTGAATEPGAATGTTGATSSAGEAYELTGMNESQAGQHVGKRVEIAGKLKAAETGPSGTTGGATAGTPPRGVDVTSPDLKLRELEVTSVRETSGTCPMQK